MPGRGTPWRFEKGAKDRIGSADIKDDTITGADIKDLTITEADLDPAVTGKLNKTGGHTIQDEGTPLTQQSNLNFVGAGVVASVGGEDTTIVTIAGGGGGGANRFPDSVPLTSALLFTDFYDNFNAPGQFGNLQGQSVTGVNFDGIELIDVIANTVGEFGGLGTVDIVGQVDSSRYTNPAKDFDYKCRQRLGTTANRIDWTGMTDNVPADSATLATAEANITNGHYFRAEDGGNWQAVSRASSTNTITDTGVATTTTNTLFEIIKTGSSVVFKINNSTVATHTTNLPSAGIFLISGVNGKTQFASFKIELDTWYLLQTR